MRANQALKRWKNEVRASRLLAQQRGAERRRERQRHEPGDRDRHRDRDRELPVHLADQPAEERDRQEHRGQHEHDRDHGPGHLLHRLDRGLARREALLGDDPLDVLEHDDRVVDHDADREHHAEQRQRVDREAEQQHRRERADQRHGHRKHRDQRCAPVLQEQEHDQRTRAPWTRRASSAPRRSTRARTWSCRRAPRIRSLGART